MLRAIAVAPSVSIDTLVFGDDERGPRTDALRLRLEALDHLNPDEQAAILTMIEGAILRHQVHQIGVTQPTTSGPTATRRNDEISERATRGMRSCTDDNS